MPQIKTQALFTIVKGNESNNKVVVKRFMDTMRSDRENTIIDNFLRSGIEIARDKFTGIGRENGNFNPSLRGFRKIISSREEGSKIRNGGMNIIQMKWGFSNL